MQKRVRGGPKKKTYERKRYKKIKKRRLIETMKKIPRRRRELSGKPLKRRSPCPKKIKLRKGRIVMKCPRSQRERQEEKISKKQEIRETRRKRN